MIYLIRSVQPSQHNVGETVEFVDVVRANTEAEARSYLPKLDIVVDPVEIRPATYDDLVAYVERRMGDNGYFTFSERELIATE